jgi:hypothetical protein
LSSIKAELFLFKIVICAQCSVLLSGWPGLYRLLCTLFPLGHQLNVDVFKIRTADVQYRELYFQFMPLMKNKTLQEIMHVHNFTIDEGIKTSRFSITFQHYGLHTQAAALGVVLLPIHLMLKHRESSTKLIK